MKTSARIYFVTGSKFKYREIADYIPGIEMLAVPNLPELQSLDLQEVIKAKLQSARDAVGESDYLVVEDTALHLCSLRGFPGPLIKFLLARLHNEGIYNLCKKLGDRKATAECAFGLFTPSVGTMEIAIARKTGTISRPRVSLASAGIEFSCPLVPREHLQKWNRSREESLLDEK